MFDWFPDWSGEIAVIVASGQSASEVDFDLVRGHCRVIVVNSSFRLAPWADALYAADRQWWECNRDALEFAGLKITGRESIGKRFAINVVNVKTINEAEPHSFHLVPRGTIGHSGNSGFQALNLALQFGSKKVMLVGFDLVGEHWHKEHAAPLRNPRSGAMALWRERLDAQAPRLKAMGVEMVNTSEQSALTAYPKMSLDEAMSRFGVMESAAA